MFSRCYIKDNVKKRMTKVLGIVMSAGMLLSLTGCAIPDIPIEDFPNLPINKVLNTFKYTTDTNIEDLMDDLSPENLIRFHVVANSDSEEDQLLKYIVRDEILKIAAPRLAESKSLEESRQILNDMEDDFIRIANTVVQEYGKDYEVTINHGEHTFPTKSYGSYVLPGGEYEAVKVEIGEAQGENWWCVLFPPVCFVNVEESTTVTVDSKAAVPLDEAGKKASANREFSEAKPAVKENETNKPKVKFFLSRFFQ